MAFIFQFRRGTAAAWAASTRPLSAGEPGLLLDSEGEVIGLKFGNGDDLWADLALYSSGGGGGADLAEHIAQHGAGTHLPEGGDFGDIPYRTSGTGVAWGPPPEGGGGSSAGTSIAVMDYDSGLEQYIAVGGVNPATAALRWWRGPDAPKNIDGGEEWAAGDFFTNTVL